MSDLTVDPQFFHQLQKPLHRSGRFDAYSHRPWKCGINSRTLLPSCARVWFTTSPVAVSSIANVCLRACQSHPIIRISASFVPSTVGVNTEPSTRHLVRPTSVWHQAGLAHVRQSLEGAGTLVKCSGF